MNVKRLIAMLLIIMLVMTSGITSFALCEKEDGGGCKTGWKTRDLVIQQKDPKTKTINEIVPGIVYLKDTRSKFKMEMIMEEGWYIAETRIFVGSEPPPLDEEGNPELDAFTVREKFTQPVGTYELAIDLKDVMENRNTDPCEDELLVSPEMVDEELMNTFDVFSDEEFEEVPAVIDPDATMEELSEEIPMETEENVIETSFVHPTKPDFVHPTKSSEGMNTAINVETEKEDEPEALEDALGDQPEEQDINLEQEYKSLESEGDETQDLTMDLLESMEAEIVEMESGKRFAGRDELNVVIFVRLRSTGDKGQTLNEVAWAYGDEMGLDTFSFIEGETGVYMIYALDTENDMFRKNVSKNPDFETTKAKIELLPFYVTARKANKEPVTLLYDTIDAMDEYGNVTETVTEERTQVKPLVAVYAEEMPGDETLYPDIYTGELTNRASDIFAAVSLDEGNSWKRTNLSRAADRSSFTLGDASLYPGFEFPGEVKKPNVKVNGNNILVAWTSKYARSGSPTYSLPEDHTYYEDDIWGVGGAQRSKDYTNVEAGFPGIEIPYSVVWTCRGFIKADGTIVWMKPERLTSGRRDAEQVAVAASAKGFAVVWQEDPDGLRPGDGAGPGHGWSGATTNHKTDIWYSYILKEDFQTIDDSFVPKGEPEDEEKGDGRPKALVPMKLPVRITDNDTLNSNNMKRIDEDKLEALNGDYASIINEKYPDADPEKLFIYHKSDLLPLEELPAENEIGTLSCDDDECGGGGGEGIGSGDGDGSHRYGLELENLLWRYDVPESDPYILFYENVNNQGVTKYVAITADGVLLDGNTGASRCNIMIQGDWAIIGYEESKGTGTGPPEDEDACCEDDISILGTGEGTGDGTGSSRYYPDRGKNFVYHSWKFTNPDTVAAGDVVNPQELEPVNPLLGPEGGLQLSWLREGYVDENGETVYENFMLDWKGELMPNYENARRPRFIIQPKSNAIKYKDPDEKSTVMVSVFKQGTEGRGRPADVMMVRWETSENDIGNPYRFNNLAMRYDSLYDEVGGQVVDWQNLSSVTPEEFVVETTTKGEEYTRIYNWEQTVDNLDDFTWEEPGINARAHRGFIRGDFLAIAYVFTPNWRQARNGHDIYNTYIRRSFDGGQTWTTDPDGSGITQQEIMKDLEGTRYVDETFIPAGDYQPARNVSLNKNNKVITIEPRLVGVPGSTLTGGVTLFPQDIQDTSAFWMTYGTETTVRKDADGNLTGGDPADIFYSFSTDRGETFGNIEMDYLKDDKETMLDGFESWDWMAKDRGGILREQAESQIRMTPDGSVFYAIWNEASEEGSDAIFRRILRKNQVGDIYSIEIKAEEAEYTVNVSADPAEAGTVAGGGMFRYGSQTTVTAEVYGDQPYTFVNWTESDEEVSQEAYYTFTVKDNRDLVANFIMAGAHTLSLEAQPPEGGTVSGGGQYNKDEVVSVTATSNEGWVFNGWTDGNGDTISKEPIFSYTMPAEDITLTANFEALVPGTYTLSMAASPADAGTATDTTNSGPYPAETIVNIEAIAVEGYEFDSWSATAGAFSDPNAASTTFTMTAENVTVTANFKSTVIQPVTYELTVMANPSEGGTATDETGTGPYEAGEVVDIVATAGDGYEFDGWTTTAGILSDPSAASTTLTMPAQAVTVTANFKAIEDPNPEFFTLTVTANPEGGNTVTGGGTYEAGTEVEVTATAKKPFVFDHWSIDGKWVSSEPNYRITVNGDMTIVANFVSNPKQ